MLAPTTKIVKRRLWRWLRQWCWYQVVYKSDNAIFLRWFFVGCVIGIGLFWAFIAAAAVLL